MACVVGRTITDRTKHREVAFVVGFEVPEEGPKGLHLPSAAITVYLKFFMLQFPARFEPADEGGYVVTFRDIPEAITQGHTLEEAKAMAADALLSAMDFYLEERLAVPCASKALASEQLVALPISVSAKVALLNSMVESKTRPADLARRMGLKPQEVTRLLNLHHATKIDTIADAFKALGLELDFQVRKARARRARWV